MPLRTRRFQACHWRQLIKGLSLVLHRLSEPAWQHDAPFVASKELLVYVQQGFVGSGHPAAPPRLV